MLTAYKNVRDLVDQVIGTGYGSSEGIVLPASWMVISRATLVPAQSAGGRSALRTSGTNLRPSNDSSRPKSHAKRTIAMSSSRSTVTD